MTLDEAIAIKGLEGQAFISTDPDDIDEAESLSIEAMQRIQVGRNNPGTHWNDLLPGETKE